MSFLEKNTPFKAFVWKKRLAISSAPHLIECTNKISENLCGLSDLNINRTTSTDKLLKGFGAANNHELISEMNISKFPINFYMCISDKNKKVLGILILYFCNLMNEVMVQHSVNIFCNSQHKNPAKLHYGCVHQRWHPLNNIVHNLLNPINYMRGKVYGFETRLRNAAPPLLDNDDVICHQVHNVVKKTKNLISCWMTFSQILIGV